MLSQKERKTVGTRNLQQGQSISLGEMFMLVDVKGSPNKYEANTVAAMIAWRKWLAVHARYLVAL